MKKRLAVFVSDGIFMPMVDLSKDWQAGDVKKMIEERGITQHELSTILGVRVATISDWVRGVVTPSRLASVALTYLDKDLGGYLKVKSPTPS